MYERNNLSDKLLSYEEPSRFKKLNESNYNNVSNIEITVPKVKKGRETGGLVVSVI